MLIMLIQGSYDSGKSGKTWKKLFTQGKPGKLREKFGFYLISGKTQGRIFLIQIFISHDHFALTFVV